MGVNEKVEGDTHTDKYFNSNIFLTAALNQVVKGCVVKVVGNETVGVGK